MGGQSMAKVVNNNNQNSYDNEIIQRDNLAVKEYRNVFVEAGAGAGKSTSLVDSVYYILAETYEVKRLKELFDKGSSKADIEKELKSCIKELQKLKEPPSREILFLQKLIDELDDILKGNISNDIYAKDIFAITFTNKATEELRVKIVDKLQEQSNCLQYEIDRKNKLLEDIDNIHISTIHKFCEDILKENAIKAGLSPDFIPAVDEDFEDIKKEVIKQYFRSFKKWNHFEKYEKALKHDNVDKKEIKSRILEIFDSMLETTAIHLKKEQIFKFDRINSFDANARRDLVKQLLEETDKLYNKYNGEVKVTDCYVNAGYACGQNAEDRAKAIENVLLFNNDDRKKAPFPKRRKDVKSDVADIIDPIIEKINSKTTDINICLANECIDCAYEIYELYLKNREKDPEHVTNNDLIFKTYELLENDQSVLNKTKAKIKRLFIDEYQDTDSLQYKIASKIADGKPDCLYLVGDPKQSIYRFRGAEPDVFFTTKDEFEKQKQTHVVHYLNINFRSNSEIIKWVNKTYQTMNLIEPALGYQYQDMLYAKNNEIDPKDLADDKNLIGFYSFKKSEPKDIRMLIEYLKKNKLVRRKDKVTKKYTYEPVQFKDIMVLMENHKHMPRYVEDFTKHNIPAQVYGESKFSNSLAVRSFIDLYEALFKNDNRGLAQAEAVFYTLYKPLFKNKKHSERLELVKNLLNGLKKRVAHMNAQAKATYLVEHLSMLMKENHIYQDFEVNFASSKLYQMLETVLSKGHKNGNELIKEFNNFYTSLIERESLIQDEVDAVMVINLHKAKGLEHPIVIWVATGKKNSYGQNISSVFKKDKLYSAELINHVRKNDGYSSEIAGLKDDEKYEDVRKEYVAATRPGEAFIFAFTNENVGLFLSKDEDRTYDFAKDADESVRTISVTDVIPEEKISISEEEAADLKEEIAEAMQKAENNPQKALEELAEQLPDQPQEVVIIENEELKEDGADVEPKYKEKDYQDAYSKESSSIKSESPSEKEKESKLRADLREAAGDDFEKSDRPQSNDVGTILHRALELLIKYELTPEEAVKTAMAENEDKVKNDVDETLFYETCVKSYKTWFDKQFSRDVYESYPEFGFSYLTESGDNKVISNGSIDLLLVGDNDYIIIDYKSDEAEYIKDDKVFEETLREKYVPQLDAYQKVVEDLFKTNNIKKKIIYFRRYDSSKQKIDVCCLDL